MRDPVRKIAEAVREASDSGAGLRIGKVTEVEAGAARVRLDVTGTAWVQVDRDVPRLDVGDRVYALQQGAVVQVAGRVTGQPPAPSHALVPLGGVTIWAGSSTVVPTGWLLCDGRAVSRTEYADLFSAIGTTYGAGDGSTTFSVPNLVSRFPLGVGSGRGRGATGGAESVTLTSSQIPGHTHSIPGAAGDVTVASGTGATAGSHTSGNTGSTGGGGSHENMPPYLVLYFIIRAL